LDSLVWLGLDRQLAVSHGDLDVVGGVDARELGADLVDPFLHLVFQPQQVAVEERTQTCERRKVGEGRKARKAIEEFRQVGQQGTRLTLNGRLIHNSSRDFRAVGGSDSRCAMQSKSPGLVRCAPANCRPTRGSRPR
jgi:hypothetical protein